MASNKEKTAKLWQFARRLHISYPLWSSLFFGIKLELNHLAEKLEPHEKLITLAPCKWRHRHSLVAITEQRVLVINCGILGIFSNEQDNSAYYGQISGSSSWGRLIHSYKFPTPGTGNTIIINGLWEGDYQRINKAFSHARSRYRMGEDEERSIIPTDTAPVEDNVTRITKKLNQIRRSFENGDLSEATYNKMRERLENELLDDNEETQ